MLPHVSRQVAVWLIFDVSQKMRATIFIAVALMVAAIVASSRVTHIRQIDLKHEARPPHFDDYDTFASLLASKRCFQTYLGPRLAALGIDWSYDEFVRRVRFEAVPKQRALLVRCAGCSVSTTEALSRVALESLRDCIRSFPYDAG